MKQTILFLIVALTLFSCKQEQPIEQKVSIFDSAMHMYLEERYSEYYQDTSSYSSNHWYEHYQNFLKAYVKKDTQYIYNYLSEKDSRKYLFNPIHLYEVSRDTSKHVTDIFELDCDEAYRVLYSLPFCRYDVCFTVYKKDSSITLDVMLDLDEQSSWTEQYIGNDSSYIIQLSYTDWEDFIQDIEYTDFWSLSSINDKRDYFDASTLYVIGLEKNDNTIKAHAVGRLGPESTAFFTLFKRLFNYSKIPKNSCLAPHS